MLEVVKYEIKRKTNELHLQKLMRRKYAIKMNLRSQRKHFKNLRKTIEPRYENYLLNGKINLLLDIIAFFILAIIVFFIFKEKLKIYFAFIISVIPYFIYLFLLQILHVLFQHKKISTFWAAILLHSLLFSFL